MQQILFSLFTTIIGLNLLAVSAAQEQSAIPEFEHYGVDLPTSPEKSPFQSYVLSFQEEHNSPTPIKEEKEDESIENDQPETVNLALPLKVNMTNTPTLTPTLTPSATPTPSMSVTSTPTATPSFTVATVTPFEPQDPVNLCAPWPTHANPKFPESERPEVCL